MKAPKTCSPLLLIVAALCATSCMLGCGRTSLETSFIVKGTPDRIFGGTPVSEGDPLRKKIVGIRIQKNQGDDTSTCTGAIIAPNLILTAAHCVLAAQESSTQIDVIFGTTDLYQITNENIHAVEKITIHPQYLALREELQANKLWKIVNVFDLALLMLKKPLIGAEPFTFLAENLPFTSVTVAGFGFQSYDLLTGQRAGLPRLNRIELQLLTSLQRSTLLVDQSHDHGVCLGDSGAPAFIMHGDIAILMGIVASVRNPGSAEICRGIGNLIKIPEKFF